MNSEDTNYLEYDDWRWHTEGRFPKDRLPEQGYVHIGMYVAWLADHEMLDSGWVAKSGVKRALAAMSERNDTPCALRDMTAGRLTGEMMTADGIAFSSAYYAPQYGYAQDWQHAFGRRADRYEVPDDWATYDLIAPVIAYRYDSWVASGKPELMHMPGFLGRLLMLWRSRDKAQPEQ